MDSESCAGGVAPSESRAGGVAPSESRAGGVAVLIESLVASRQMSHVMVLCRVGGASQGVSRDSFVSCKRRRASRDGVVVQEVQR